MTTEDIRAFCLSLPHVTEDLKWEVDLCFCIGGKMFLVLCTDPGFQCSFKVDDEEYETLACSPNVIPAPYMARNKWIQVKDGARFGQKEWQERIRHAYEIALKKLPKKVQATLE